MFSPQTLAKFYLRQSDNQGNEVIWVRETGKHLTPKGGHKGLELVIVTLGICSPLLLGFGKTSPAQQECSLKVNPERAQVCIGNANLG